MASTETHIHSSARLLLILKLLITSLLRFPKTVPSSASHAAYRFKCSNRSSSRSSLTATGTNVQIDQVQDPCARDAHIKLG
ncbi:hypothetical protein O6H91_Y037100 [Diphasiastrum complanatum]|nr:hypothetical protein O6H91_Y037100 [Diphasiastrum complanatum]